MTWVDMALIVLGALIGGLAFSITYDRAIQGWSIWTVLTCLSFLLFVFCSVLLVFVLPVFLMYG